MFRSPLDHHQGTRCSYPTVTTDHLLVRYSVVLRQRAAAEPHCNVRYRNGNNQILLFMFIH
jgi:hypothetical protein